jgi:hypothetical protein
VHAGAVQHRLPVDELGGAGAAVPGTSFERFRLELDQVALERFLEPRQRGLDPLGGTPERRRAPSRRRRLRVAASPALEQAAERERRDLAGAQLRDQPTGGRLLGGALVEQLGPAGQPQTSISTGRIIGRRRVRS